MRFIYDKMPIEEEILEIINEGKLHKLDLDTLIELRSKIKKGKVKEVDIRSLTISEIKGQDNMAVHLSNALTELEKANASTNCDLCKIEIERIKKYLKERMKIINERDLSIKIAFKRGYKSWHDIPENEKEEIRREVKKIIENDRRGDYI